MPKLKMLPLLYWMEHLENQVPTSGIYKPIGRDGYYRRGDLVWFEINNRCFVTHGTTSVAHFELHLAITDEKILRPADVAALKTVIGFTKNKQLIEILQQHEEALQLRSSYRDARKLMLSIFKEVTP